jgi:hypothetical protein
MDPLSLIAACALDYDARIVAAIAEVESGLQPYAFRMADDDTLHTFSSLDAVIAAARAAYVDGQELRVGLTGLAVDLSVATADPVEPLFMPCPNAMLAAKRLRDLEETCRAESGAGQDPTTCAIAAYGGSFDTPDHAYVDAVLLAQAVPNQGGVELPEQPVTAPAASQAASAPVAVPDGPVILTATADPDPTLSPEALRLLEGGGPLHPDDVAETLLGDDPARQLIVPSRPPAAAAGAGEGQVRGDWAGRSLDPSGGDRQVRPGRGSADPDPERQLFATSTAEDW